MCVCVCVYSLNVIFQLVLVFILDLVKSVLYICALTMVIFAVGVRWECECIRDLFSAPSCLQTDSWGQAGVSVAFDVHKQRCNLYKE